MSLAYKLVRSTMKKQSTLKKNLKSNNTNKLPRVSLDLRNTSRSSLFQKLSEVSRKVMHKSPESKKMSRTLL